MATKNRPPLDKAQEFPWQSLIFHLISVLGISPREFWSMSMREALLTIQHGKSTPGLSRDELTSLMRQFPDNLKSTKVP